MKIFLLEDELSQQIRVEKHIAEIAKELEIKLEVISTGKISEFENYIQHSDIHQLYFLDIHIQDNEYCGLEIAKKIRDINPSVILIFLTSFPEYALSGYKVKAFDYLVKPLSYLQLENVLDQAISELKSNEKHFLIIKDSGNIFKIKFLWDKTEKKKNVAEYVQNDNLTA